MCFLFIYFFIFSSSFFLFGDEVDGKPALSCTVELVGGDLKEGMEGKL